MIIGTAGHIDHGKTSLVKMLTDIDTDRLAEEKARGISIELGFAHLDFDSGNEAGVVDVPGHERFIRQMLAGAHGMDLVLLVVAADDGVMPQTEEHLDILHLLGVSHGIVVMTKIDLVDEARRRAVREEVEILLAETTLESAPVVEVSSTTGTGIAELRAVIQAAAAAFERPVPQGCFRLPIDRSFSIHGHGLVVTGTATAGSVREESILRVLPGSHEARVRSIQVHGNSVTEACVGQRIALNLGGLDKENAPRGAVLCDPELDRVSDRFDAFVEIRPGAKRPLASHVQVRIHQGTAEVLGRIVWFGGLGEVAPKGSGYAQIILREPTAIFGGDRFVVRDETARRTIGGGVVLNPFAGKPERREPSRLPHLAALHRAPDMVARIDALLAMQQAFSVSVGDLAATLNLRADQVRKELRNSSLRGLPDNVHAEAYTTAAKWENLTQQAQAALAAYHVASATQPGMEMESLRSQMAGELSPKVFRVIVEDWERRKLVVRDQSLLRLPEHQVGLTVRDRQLAAAIENILADANLTPPDVKQIAVDLKIEPRRFDEILQQLEREQRIVRVSPDLYYAPAAIDRCRELVREHVARNGQIDAAALRDLLQASRKFSIALLTYFDRIGFTLRIGDIRKLKSKS